MKKGKKIVMKVSITMADTFGDFIMPRKAKGLSDKTITTYKQQLLLMLKEQERTVPTIHPTGHASQIPMLPSCWERR